MSNALGGYNPTFFANEALAVLYKSLGFGSRVHRDADPNPQQRGSTITITRPSTFTATDMPASNSDIAAADVSVLLDKWKGVVFSLTDKELSHTKEKIIEDHIAPAAYAVADAIDQSVAALYKDIPWQGAASAPLAVADITAARQRLVQNAAPKNDGRLSLALSPTLYKEALDLTAFTQWQGAGGTGVTAQQDADLGRKFGFNVFENQNVQTQTAGVSADAVGALTANAAAGVTSIAIDSVTTAGTFKAGDTLVIAGNTQRYAITADATASGGAVTLSITPPLVAAATSTTVVTITLTSGDISMAFHRDAFCLAMAPLSTLGGDLGAKIKNVTDDNSGLSLRARMWYDGGTAKVYVGLDALWGVKTLNPNLAYRIID